jgi:outer membrane immunogenic protein
MRVFRVLAATALTAILMSNAQAADFPTLRGSQYDASPSSLGQVSGGSGVDWNGFTIGVHGGLSRSYFDFDNSMQSLAAQPLRQTALLSEYNPPNWIQTRSGQDRGQTWGAMVGYNLMIDDIVVGLEADYTRANQGHSSADLIGRRVVTSNSDVNDVTLTSNQTVSVTDYATARIRLGYVVGRFMPFVTLGGAVGRFDSTKTVGIDWRFQRAGVGGFGNAFGFPTVVSDSKRDVYGYGLTGGAGLDIALTDFAFVRAEYQYVRFADIKGTTVDMNTIRVGAGVKF